MRGPIPGYGREEGVSSLRNGACSGKGYDGRADEGVEEVHFLAACEYVIG